MKVSKLFAILAVVCLVIALCGVGAQAAKSPYLIGALFDVSGTGSPLGTPERDTVKMLEAQINKAGGISGHPVRFIYYDNASENTTSVLMAKRLIEADKVKAIIGPSQTGTTLAIAAICQKAGIPLVSCAAGVKIVDPGWPFVFKTAQSDVHAVAKVIDFLKTRKITRIAFINVSNAFGKSGWEQMDMQAKRARIAIVEHQEFGTDDSDMTSQLVRIKSKNPQAVVCWGTNPGPAHVAKNFKQLNMHMPLIMSHGIANKKFIEIAGRAADGVVFPAGRLIVAKAIPNSDPQKKILLNYAAQFKKAYGRDADTFGGHAWDAAQLVVNAMRKVGDNPKKIRAELEKAKFVGISGVFKFAPRDHNGLSKDAFVLVKINNGKWFLLKK